MDRPHYIVYLPGLGDDTFGPAQTKLLKLWKVYKLNAHYHYIGWADGEAFAPKLERILAAIDKHAKGQTVSLVGTSAGASAALNAYAARKDVIHSVVCICGKLRNPQTIVPARFKQNPAFQDSLTLLPSSLATLTSADRKKILSIRPLKDNMVPPADTFIEGARTALVPTAGHGLSILYALTIGSRRVASFIKSASSSF
jgi:pimeloyl-ACP methyl ester carboxylesterase